MAVSVPSMTSVSSVVGVYDSVSIDIARSIISGESEDYYIFNYSDDITVCLVGNLDYVNGSVFSDSCMAYAIKRSVSRIPLTRTDNFSFGGSNIGANPSTFNGQGSLSHTVEYDTKISYELASSVVSNVSVYNPNQSVFYSSFPNSPHLREGVENYAFAGFVLAFTVIAYRLSSAIFKRVH